MSTKYYIQEIQDTNLWQHHTEQTPQYTMFVSSSYLKSFGGKYKLFFIKKGVDFKAGFCVLLSQNEQDIVFDDLVIYSGIFFRDDPTQKDVKSRLERFELTELMISFLTSTYKNIKIALSTKIEDLRPFLWHNYGSSDKTKIFTLDLRYTSYLDISELAHLQNEEKTDIFVNLETLRQRNIRKARQEKAYTVQETNIELFLEYYKILMNSQNQEVSSQKLQNMANVITENIANNQAIMYTTKNNKDEIIYITVFSYDKYRAYYLFGAGNINASESYKGTVCFWDAFINLAQNYNIKEVDLEGINSPQRGWFKLSFGGNIIPYYEISIGE